MKLNLGMTGKEQLLKNLASLGNKGPKIIGAALWREGTRIMGEAKAITPVDLGPLRASGHVALPVLTPTGAEVTLGFGGSAAPYAVYVHENLNARHAAPTSAKFLERPLLAAANGMAERLNADLQRDFKP